MSIHNFDFIPGAIEAINILSGRFKHIFIVTNQQCIGKGLISIEEVYRIHLYMLEQIESAGGHITDIFIAPSLEKDKDPLRKPGTGMALEAVSKYPDTDLSKSVMAGDSLADMLFGKKTGMINVLISPETMSDEKLFDYRYNNLLEFALSLD